ncbi:leucine-rich repeat flightless-interacting 1-like isoform X8 [Pelobates cultripes]|uniref:Leucine-rich repeat flightless-interacting 1-like isoform X8 n=2 Tax=Pelobates cultripes TaxID=61616 RepID=A0AAD1WH99_PELCU|nr:leucine-rich repeat flightless-interacting 1-like isoform X8 [Pelobates cultripes]
MGTQGPGRKRHPNREGLSAEDQALNQIAREAEARLAAKRAARAEAREIRMKELERQQKEIYQVQKKYYGLDAKWGDIEQWMEDSERYSNRIRRNPQASDEDDIMSVGSRSSLRTNGYEEELLGVAQYRKSSRGSNGSGEIYQSSLATPRDEAMSAYSSDPSLASVPQSSKPQQAMHNGSRPSLLNCNTLPSRSQRGSLYDEGITSGSRRYSSSSSRPPSEYSYYLGSGSRASSRASSARASPVVEERPEKDFSEKGSRPVSSLSAATLASLGGTSSRRGSGDTSISVDTEASIREIKDSLAEVEEKYKRSMVANAQLDNEKTSFMYQVDTLREVLLELEEELAESRRQYDDKHKECERQKHEQNVLHFQLAELKNALQQREEMLTEIRQLQQKQEQSAREICDLQETIEWKDKKIGALERQKEFFDPVRSERDDLREEVARLKEELKKHGVAVEARSTPNGDSSLEPHINEDCVDSPLKGASLGNTQKTEVKKEEISIASQGSTSGTEKDSNEVQENVRENVSLHAMSGEAIKENNDKEMANTKCQELETVVSGNCIIDNLQANSNLQQEASQICLKETTSDGEDEIVEEDIGKDDMILDKNVTEVDGELAQNPRNVSPTGSEVFQDALDFVAQTPNLSAGLQEASFFKTCTGGDKESQSSQQESTLEESSTCNVESSSREGDIFPEIVNTLESKPEVPPVQDEEDLAKTKGYNENKRQENATSDSVDNSLTEEIKESTITSSRHNEACEKNTGDEEATTCQSSAVEQEPVKEFDNKDKVDSEPTEIQHENIPKEEEMKIPGIQKTTDEQLTLSKSETVDAELKEQEITGEEIVNSAVNDKLLAQDKTSLIKQTPQDKAAHLDEIEAHTDVRDVVTCMQNQSDGVKETEDVPFCPDLECNTENPTEKEDETVGVGDFGMKQNTPDDDLEPDDNCKKQINSTQSTDENQSETTQSESLSSEEESSQEVEDSDENENHSAPNEKYPGEREMPRTPIGSSVDRASSSEDVRLEDGAEKTVKRGKGKNKEDCLLS